MCPQVNLRGVLRRASWRESGAQDRLLQEWLTERGLQFSEEKTRIVHLQDGFDFLGFTIRHYRNRRTATGWKLLITPSKKSVAKGEEKLRAIWRRGLHWPLDVLLPPAKGKKKNAS